MIRVFILVTALTGLIVSCNNSSNESAQVSANEFYPFFYPYDSIAKVYVYRDEAHGMDEVFHRVVGVEDSKGKHLVVEIYSQDGRLLEGTTFNVDSLDVMDHMLSKSRQDRVQTRLQDVNLFPMNQKDTGKLVQIMPINDTLLIYRETIRSYSDELMFNTFEGEKKTVLFSDFTTMSLVTTEMDKQETISTGATYYFSEGLGLVRWHTDKKDVDFVLQKTLSQREFMDLISRL